MSRLLLVVALGLLGAAPAAGQCLPWYPVYPPRPVYGPVYPLTPAIWGAPAPKPLPPAPAPFTPKPGVAVQEDEDLAVPRPADKPKEGPKPKGPGLKETDAPRLPKVPVLLPGDPIEPDPGIVRPPAPKKEGPGPDASPRKEPPSDRDKAVEQFFIPAEGGRGEPRAEVKVGFFNHSDREIVLDVNGESVRLPSEQYVTLRLPRTFKWGEKGKKGTEATVPADADGIEIVFRK
jgi:hypothetical protein